MFDTGKPELTGVFAPAVDRAPVVAMGVPVWKGDAVAYTLAVVLAPDAIFASARRSMPDGWIAAIIDRDGNIAARSRDGERYVGQRATPSLLAAIDGRSEGTSETMTKDDGAMLTAFSRSTRGDWTVAVGVPKTLLVASLHRSIAWLAVAALAVLGGVLWFAYRISHAVTRAVDELVEPAMALGNGRPVDVRPTPFREVDAVGRAIRQASRRLTTAQHHAYHDPLREPAATAALFDEMALRIRSRRRIATARSSRSSRSTSTASRPSTTSIARRCCRRSRSEDGGRSHPSGDSCGVPTWSRAAAATSSR